MIEERARGLDQEVLRMFRSSYMKRYEQWKRGGLLLIAIQTMPKQVFKTVFRFVASQTSLVDSLALIVLKKVG